MQLNETVLVPVIISLIEMLKGLGLPSKYCPFVALGLGILAGVFLLEPGNIPNGVLDGIVYGLTASGLYSGTKCTVGRIRQNRDKS